MQYARLIKLLCFICALSVLTLTLFGCSGVNNDKKGEGKATKLIIHLAGNMQENKDDNAVKAALEEKFFKDTGNRVDLEFIRHSNEDFNQKVNLAIAGNEQIDGISNYIGKNGLTDYINKPDYIMPIDDLIKDATNLQKKIPKEAWDSIKFEKKIMGIPSVTNKASYGILIRKDWLDAAKLSTPKTIPEFEAVLDAFKKRGENIIPLMATPWDMERIFAGSFDVYPYWGYWLDPADKLLKNSTMNPNYINLLNMEYKWVKNGWWDKDNINRPEEDRINKFISGQSGIFIYWPEVMSLIDISRKTKLVDPNATFDIIQPPVGPNGNWAICEQPIAFGGVIIPKSSKNAKLMVDYINWLYAAPENYELAWLGQEGKDWTNAGEGLYGIPDAIKDTYISNPPYSGVYRILENINVSSRIRTTYTEQERQWIKNVRGFKTTADPANGVIFPEMKDYSDMFSQYYDNGFYALCQQPAWVGLTDPSTTYNLYRQAYLNAAADYFKALTNIYNEARK